MVDCVVVAPPEQHWQTFGTAYNPAFSGEIRVPMRAIPPMEMGPRKIIARRAAFELRPNSVVNLGIGMPEGIANVANEEQTLEYLTLTTEPGTIGGMPAGGLNFGAASNIQALVDQPAQFDFYDGGGLDMAFLGMAQTDRGGQRQRQQVRPPAGGSRRLHQHQPERQEGRVPRHLLGARRVRSSWSGWSTAPSAAPWPCAAGQPVLYITDRCVFRLTAEGLELTEVAPGVDIERDILNEMAFRPVISARSGADGPPHLRTRPDALPGGMAEPAPGGPPDLRAVGEPVLHQLRRAVDPPASRMSRTSAARSRSGFSRSGRKVLAIVNYDNFRILPELLDAYTDMVKGLADRFYSGVTRYTTSAFMHMKFGDALQRRAVSPHIYESREEAERYLYDLS